MSEEIQREQNSALEELPQAKAFNRIAASGLDFVFFLIVTIGLQFLASFVLTQKGTVYAKAYNVQYDHVIAADLSKYEEKRGYISFENADYYQEEDGNYKVINHLAYYYLSYLTGENLKEDYICSLEKDIPIEGIAKKDYYTVKWFNENILSLGSDGGDSDYFTYQKTDDNNDYSKIGTLKDEFVLTSEKDGTTIKYVIQDNGLYAHTKKIYNNAIKHLYSQGFMKDATRTMNLTNSFILLGSSIIPLIIFYIIIPMFSDFGLTLGKRFLSLLVVSDHGFVIKKYQLLLRCIPLLATIIFISFINNLYISFIFAGILVLASLSFMVFTRNNQAIHDFIARTAVVKNEGEKIFKNSDEYTLYLHAMKERKNKNERD